MTNDRIAGRTRNQKKADTREALSDIFFFKKRFQGPSRESVCYELLEEIRFSWGAGYGGPYPFDLDDKDVARALRWMHSHGRIVMSRHDPHTGQNVCRVVVNG